jgi:hypothetical protein
MAVNGAFRLRKNALKAHRRRATSRSEVNVMSVSSTEGAPHYEPAPPVDVPMRPSAYEKTKESIFNKRAAAFLAEDSEGSVCHSILYPADMYGRRSVLHIVPGHPLFTFT